MVELAGSARLADELINPLGLLAVLRAEDLERDFTRHRTLLGLVDDAHPAFAQLFAEFIFDDEILQLDIARLFDKQEFDFTNTDAVTECQETLTDLLAIELGAVARTKINQTKQAAITAHLAVQARGHVVDDLHLGCRLSTHAGEIIHQRELASCGGSGLGNQFSHEKQRPRREGPRKFRA